jgi:maleate isomerase
MDVPGPKSRLGILVPSSNSNAESMTAAILAQQPDLGVHYSRFRLPPNLDDAVDLGVLGDAPALLAEAEIEAVAFHGTSGSWTGIDGDRALCQELKTVTGAPATTASLAILEACSALGVNHIAVVFPGPQGIGDMIQREYAANGVTVTAVAVPACAMSNPEISRLGRGDIEILMLPAFEYDAEAVVCVGTNLRSGYLAADLERRFGVPVIDSAVATLWQLLRVAGVDRPIQGWGRLLAAS